MGRLRSYWQRIRQFLDRGGRILCLSQSQLPKWCPVRLNSWSASRRTPTAFLGFGWQDQGKEIYYSRHAPIYAPGHPVFEGLTQSDVRWWNSLDGRVSDDAYARPAATGAVARGNWRPLLGACRRENLSLVEVSVGEGLLMLLEDISKRSARVSDPHHPSQAQGKPKCSAVSCLFCK